jgi:hypothetical protein
VLGGPALLLLFTLALLVAVGIGCRLLGLKAWAAVDWLSDLPQEAGDRLHAARVAAARWRARRGP